MEAMVLMATRARKSRARPSAPRGGYKDVFQLVKQSETISDTRFRRGFTRRHPADPAEAAGRSFKLLKSLKPLKLLKQN